MTVALGMSRAMISMVSVGRTGHMAVGGISPSVAMPVSLPAGPGMTVPRARAGVMAYAIQTHRGQAGAAQQ
jgi:hypothetical protein